MLHGPSLNITYGLQGFFVLGHSINGIKLRPLRRTVEQPTASITGYLLGNSISHSVDYNGFALPFPSACNWKNCLVAWTCTSGKISLLLISECGEDGGSLLLQAVHI